MKLQTALRVDAVSIDPSAEPRMQVGSLSLPAGTECQLVQRSELPSAGAFVACAVVWASGRLCVVPSDEFDAAVATGEPIPAA